MTTSPYGDIVFVDPNQTGKTVTINEGLQALSALLCKAYQLDCSAGGTISPTYDAAEGGTKDGLWFGILNLTGSPAADFAVSLPAKPHMFACHNGTGKTATIGGVTIASNTNKMVFYTGGAWAGIG